MKLRNKKTGEIIEDTDLGKCISSYDMSSYNSLAELNEEWEDYEPKEPLIKDEQIRKVVRAWAKLNCSHELHMFNYYQLEDENNYLIEFVYNCFTNLEVGKNYTIAELCGDEE